MRVLFFILVIFVLSLAAQTPNVKKVFAAGMQNAQNGQLKRQLKIIVRLYY
jgi:hypothetical protein